MGTLCYVYVEVYLNNSVREIIYYTHHNKNASQGVLSTCNFCELSLEKDLSHTSHRYGCCAACIHVPGGYTAPFILYYTHHRNKNGPHWVQLDVFSIMKRMNVKVKT
jgi:hypothetical protein